MKTASFFCVAALLASAAFAPVGLGACKSSDDGAGASDAGADAEPPDPPSVSFPAGFMWGTATAAFQVEKGDTNTDWSAWVHTEGKIKNGDEPDKGGDDAFAHVADDVGLMQQMGMNAYRLSIELARVYPTRDAFDKDTPDADALANYDEVLAALADAHVTPMVTLEHFTLPIWLADPAKSDQPQGWELDDTVSVFETWCGRAAKRWGDRVEWWATINEPIVPLLAGYLAGQFPPGLLLQVDRGFKVGKNEAIGHVKCFDAIHANDATAKVGIVQHQRFVEPADPTEPEDVTAADKLRYINNEWILNIIVDGDWDDDLDGSLDGPNDRKADPALKGRSDYLGINYYSVAQASTVGLKIPVVNAAVQLDHIGDDRPKTDLAWDIYPKGIPVILDEVKRYNLPIVITENGIADSRDVNRGRFVLEHLFELGKAIGNGADVIGYFHWSLIDNFEWASGFCPKFGLASVDAATGARTLRPSASLYGAVAKSNTLAKATVDAQPAYVAPAPCE